MSTFVQLSVKCPACGAADIRDVAASVNVSRTPAARDQVLAQTFQVFVCPSCDHRFLYTGAFTYVDLDRDQLIGVFPSAAERNWTQHEQSTADAYRATLGDGAPIVARSIGVGVVVRTVFGLAALREKLLLFDSDLDDVLFEAAKLDVMRTIPDAPLDADHRPRLMELDDAEVRFAMSGLTPLTVPRSDLDRWIAAAAARRPELEAQLAGGPYVDLGRLLLAER